MLRRISCDKFMENGTPRSDIEFFDDLNIVIGGERGTNSIGKSTFLLILDYVFGGSDYISIATDAQKYLGPHSFKFEFEFDGIKYWFSRSTTNDTQVEELDKDGNVVKTLKLDEYTKWLQEMYGLEQLGLTFRGAVSRYIRVANRENLDTKKPLATAKHEKDSDGIAGLLKLFDAYAPIKERKTAYDSAKEEETGFKTAQKYKYIPVARNQTEVKENQKRIDDLIKELDDLSKKNSEGLLQLSAIQRKQLADLSERHSVLDQQKTVLEIQLRGIRADKTAGKKKFQNSYESLLNFFPNANVERLETVESFHRQITGILKDEFKEAEIQYLAMIESLTKEIAAIEAEMKKVAVIPNLSEAIIRDYSAKETEKRKLEQANESFFTNARLHETTKHEEDLYNQMTLQQIAKVQVELNERLKKLNSDVCGPNSLTAPILMVEGAKKYSYLTDDTGTGNAYKNLALFDIACLQLSDLPFLIHDSLLFDNVESDRVERLLKIYKDAGKQVFISLDREFNYTEESREIIDKHEILRLERGGRELFGVTWSDTLAQGKGSNTADSNTEE